MKINELLSIALIALTFEACTTDATNNNVPQQQTSEQKIINTTENAYDNTLLVKLHSYTDTFALEIDGVMSFYRSQKCNRDAFIEILECKLSGFANNPTVVVEL